MTPETQQWLEEVRARLEKATQEPASARTLNCLFMLVIALWFILQFFYLNPMFARLKRIESMKPCVSSTENK